MGLEATISMWHNPPKPKRNKRKKQQKQSQATLQGAHAIKHTRKVAENSCIQFPSTPPFTLEEGKDRDQREKREKKNNPVHKHPAFTQGTEKSPTSRYVL